MEMNRCRRHRVFRSQLQFYFLPLYLAQRRLHADCVRSLSTLMQKLRSISASSELAMLRVMQR